MVSFTTGRTGGQQDGQEGDEQGAARGGCERGRNGRGVLGSRGTPEASARATGAPLGPAA